MNYEAFRDTLMLLDIPFAYDGRIDCDNETLIYEWVTGGQSGGSCWGTDYYPRSAEQPPALTIIDFVLESFVPTITYLQYRKVAATMMVEGERRSHDYYGNYTEYTTRAITIRGLYNVLTGMGYLQEVHDGNDANGC